MSSDRAADRPRTLRRMERRFARDGKPSAGELNRMQQLMKTLSEAEAREIRVTWVESGGKESDSEK